MLQNLLNPELLLDLIKLNQLPNKLKAAFMSNIISIHLDSKPRLKVILPILLYYHDFTSQRIQTLKTIKSLNTTFG